MAHVASKFSWDILTHGIIDLFFEEEGELVLVDYKSDKPAKAGGEAAIITKYAPQLKRYKKALEQARGHRVKECFIYLFSANKAVAVELL
jgi:ATP-dependent helicase/nuclease subunit A